ncbi:hypothetical protein [Lacticaseibacillus saniviri]|uniref:Glycosyl-4,4'-diaponeurosporenoate acyltransferase n=1 Tax=Lacticaseibacillus saniviri JCM 17471 = DSM 24301 TaxID=1293598 RepID=A0A0R2MZN5_9LACO|nr:hypothetical protein [Lacticaseibacillus saniviri]KRO17723.1 hypothetical protein IV56_GL002209 [Lacticaseibacillus saniviri JCM 17471 = DSM 24301]MCG4281386.1 hypothetical protein [Lacticaseibacillus saniviri]
MREQIYVVLAFIGGWMLYFYPLYQGVLELSEQKRVIDKFRGTDVAYPPVSPWYWLLPPLKISKEKQRGIQILRDRVDQEEESDELLRFFNRATAWFYIALAGILNGIVVTGTMLDQWWPAASVWLSIGLDLVMIALGVVHVRYRMGRRRGQKLMTRLFNRD